MREYQLHTLDAQSQHYLRERQAEWTRDGLSDLARRDCPRTVPILRARHFAHPWTLLTALTRLGQAIVAPHP